MYVCFANVSATVKVVLFPYACMHTYIHAYTHTYTYSAYANASAAVSVAFRAPGCGITVSGLTGTNLQQQSQL